MTVPLAAVAASLLAASLPEGTARYAVELGGEAIGVAELSVRCDGRRCRVVWATALRAPEEAGGAVRRRQVAASVDRSGRLAGAVRVVEDGAPRPGRAVAGHVPAAAAELALLAPGAPACLGAFDEESGRTGTACARRAPGAIIAEVLGVREALRPAPDGFPAEVRIPAQGVRFVRRRGAAVPARAPRLSVRVPGPREPAAARGFCGVAPDTPPRAAPPRAAPAARPSGARCRTQAEGWIREAERAGLDARAAVGVAHDGAGFVWHAWAEVRDGGGWIAVDPAFGQAPARGPRFTVARYRPGDAAARAEAGRRILACWGRGGVE